jgi:hypothetical protein
MALILSLIDNFVFKLENGKLQTDPNYLLVDDIRDVAIKDPGHPTV